MLAPIHYEISVPQALPAGMQLPSSLKLGAPLLRVTPSGSGAGGSPAQQLSAEGFLSTLTDALLASAGPGAPIQCTKVPPGEQLAALWQSASFNNIIQENCTLTLEQKQSFGKGSASTSPPVAQCALRGSPAAARAQLQGAIAQVLQVTPAYTLRVPLATLVDYLAAALPILFPDGGSASCMEVSLQRSAVDFTDDVFTYGAGAECVACVLGTLPPSPPPCISVQQTLPHPLLRCMRQVLAFQEVTQPAPEPPAPAPVPVPAPAHGVPRGVWIGAGVVLGVVLLGVIVGVATRKRHTSRAVPGPLSTPQPPAAPRTGLAVGRASGGGSTAPSAPTTPSAPTPSSANT